MLFRSALEHRLSSCDAWAYLLPGMWNLPGPGLKPMSPALAGGFLTTATREVPLGPTLTWEISMETLGNNDNEMITYKMFLQNAVNATDLDT